MNFSRISYHNVSVDVVNRPDSSVVTSNANTSSILMYIIPKGIFDADFVKKVCTLKKIVESVLTSCVRLTCACAGKSQRDQVSRIATKFFLGFKDRCLLLSDHFIRDLSVNHG